MAEPNDTRTLDSMSRKPILSGLTWFATYLMLKSIFKPYFTVERRDRLDAVVAEAKKTSRAVCRRLLLSLFDYLDQHGDLSERLTTTKVPVSYLRGEQDNIGFRDEARAILARCPRVAVKDLAGSRHFAMIDQPQQVNAIILEMLRA
jgi:pimeloyl-ACP methyl ester carboxylesterase